MRLRLAVSLLATASALPALKSDSPLEPATHVATPADGATTAPRPILLIHVPKTGGDSVKEALGIGANQNGDVTAATPECASVRVLQPRHLEHMTAAEVRARLSQRSSLVRPPPHCTHRHTGDTARTRAEKQQ